MQLRNFHWLSFVVYQLETMLYKNGKRMRIFSDHLYFYFILVFYTLRALLIRQLIHSHFSDMR